MRGRGKEGKRGRGKEGKWREGYDSDNDKNTTRKDNVNKNTIRGIIRYRLMLV